MQDDDLTWIVPCRRAVLKRTISYRELVGRWLLCLRHSAYRDKMLSWYQVEARRYDAGLAAVAAWQAQLGTRTLSICREGDNRADSSRPFYVRLWKGPLRVLLEEDGAGSSGEGSESAAPCTGGVRTTIAYAGEQLHLELSSSQRQVMNSNARFLMGDVVEFPLAALLVACGKSAYQGISFNPDGSFFTGTALAENGSPRALDARPWIHDNLLAMRFQLILNVMRGSFYNLAAVYGRNTASNGEGQRVDINPSADDPSSRVEVHARGIMYGRYLGDPAQSSERRSGHWMLLNNSWRVKRASMGNDEVPTILPSRSGLANLGPDGLDAPITPAIACSAASLTLAYYLHNHFDWGTNSVTTTITDPDHQDQLPRDLYPERVRHSVLLGESEQGASWLIGKIDNVLSHLTASASYREYWGSCLTVTHIHRRFLSRQPQLAMPRVCALLAEADLTAEEREQAVSTHRCLYGKWMDVGLRMRQILSSTVWRDLSVEPPDVPLEIWRRGVDEATESTREHDGEFGAACHDDHGLNQSNFDAVREALSAARDRLRRATSASENRRDLSNVFSDLTVIGKSRHELSVVKIYPFDQLMARPTLPLSHRLSAYDPLSGVEQFDDAALAEAGQMFFFEATASLIQWGGSDQGRVNACDTSPFKWHKIEGNRLHVYPTRAQNDLRARGISDTPVYLTHGPRGRGSSPQKVNAVHRFSNETLRGIYPGNEYRDAASGHAEWKPWVVEGMRPRTGHAGVWTNSGRPVGDADAAYSERAVPLPTLGEADASFPRASQVAPYLNTAYDMARRSVAPFTPGGERDTRLRGDLRYLRDRSVVHDDPEQPGTEHTQERRRLRFVRNTIRGLRRNIAALARTSARSLPNASSTEIDRLTSVAELLEEHGAAYYPDRDEDRRTTIERLRRVASDLEAIDGLGKAADYLNAMA